MTEAFDDLIADIVRFRDERNWAQFHTFKDLMISLNIEATELIELAQWKDERQIEAALKSLTLWRRWPTNVLMFSSTSS